jgi:ribulose-bisphosphate carboxylase large chain
MPPRLIATYHVRCDAGAADERARVIAVEQSVEMPVAAIDDEYVRSEIIARVESVRDLRDGRFEARIGLAAETVGSDAGQLINMLFGNTSLHEDVILADIEIPDELAATFGGPGHGLHELRRRAGAGRRALTCSALKPQGLPPAKLADLARQLAQGGIDYIKDDHGLADQAYSPFELRVAAITRALQSLGTDNRSRYVPSLSGDLDGMRRQIAVAADAGVDTVMVAPMIMGLASFHRLVRDHPATAFFAHPALAGLRVSPVALLGKLFRLLGADAVIFPNHGGRFGYSPETCRGVAQGLREDRQSLKPSLPVPAGGMSRERVRELLDFYGADGMLLIGGALLETRERLVEATCAFVAEVQSHDYG